ncbi:MAG: marine proteobacterial sortase target protein [Thermoanaerobaculia bacterium]
MGRRIAALLLFIAAAAAAANDKPLVTLNLVKSGMMLLKTNNPGLYVPAPAVQTDVDLRVRGMILRGEVTQRFRNPESECVEAIYAFPLPETAAVDRLRMKIGQRVIEGEIKERKAAEQVYEQAKSEGKHASLLSQERPNLFTVAISNIGAGEEVVVTIDYQQTVDYKDGAFRFRFPTTIGPRYIPGKEVPVVASGTRWSVDTDQVAHASRVTPPVNLPGEQRQNHLRLSVDLDSGVSLSRVESPYFKTDATTLSPSHYLLSLTDAPADRDFELVWRPDLGSAPQSALFTEKDFALLMLMPPARSISSARMPKESIFIIDTSGSMAGPSLQSAKKALLLALDRLSPSDRFNVIEFNSVTHTLFEHPRVAGADVLANAKEWVNALQSTGGTEMLPALQAALLDPSPANDGVVRQVIFMTDGDVGNESELFTLIRTKLGRSRLFTVGIGAAPNSHFMRNAARFGRGTFTYIANVSEVQEKMTALFEKLESPVLTNVELRFDDPAAEVWPQRVPDLYAGEPVVVAVKFASPSGRVILSGKSGGQEWNEVHSVAATGVDSGIGRLWGRMKIEALTDEPSDGTRQKIIDLGLEHHLVTQFTSLVAVDVTPASSVSQRACETRAVPVNLPAGWGGMEGSLPQTATPAPLLLLAGALLMIVASWRLVCALR